MWRLPQEGVWARLDSLITDATPLCQMCQTLPAPHPWLVGWDDPVCIRPNNLYWDIMRAR